MHTRRRATMPASPATALLVALTLCALPAAARGQSPSQSPFSQLPSAPPSTPTVTAPTPSTTSTSGGGLSSTEQIALFGAGILLIGGIAFLIRRDAHAQAPAGRPAGAGPRATTKPKAKRVEQSRSRAKAARRQRKRARARSR
ncbi:MAG: hypothetical protein ACR2KV_05785 [Solirubrobacteraceae bacterium]